MSYESNKTQHINILKQSFNIVLSFIAIEFITAKLFHQKIFIFYLVIIIHSNSDLPFKNDISIHKTAKIAFENRRKNPIINNFIHPLLSFVIGFSLDQMMHYPKNTKHLIYDFINFGADERGKHSNVYF